MSKRFIDQIFGNQVKGDCFEVFSNHVDITSEGGWASYTKFQALSKPTVITVKHQANVGEGGIIQDTYATTFKDGEVTAARLDNSCWNKTTVSLYTAAGTEYLAKELSSKTPEGKCSEIQRFFKSYPFAAKVLCTENVDAIETLLQENGHTLKPSSS